MLDWKVEPSLSFRHFIVEASKDGRNFSYKGTVPSVTGQTDYTFADMLPYEGVSYYRITMIGTTDLVDYSQTVMIEVKKPSTLTVYPNPASSMVTVKMENAEGKSMLVQLIDAAGNRVFYNTFPASSTFQLDVSSYPNGFYILRVNDQIFKLMISK